MATYNKQESFMLNSKSSTVTVPELTPNTTDSPEETKLLPNYAKLPTTNLKEETNPFEQSFEGAGKIVPLPPEIAKPFVPTSIIPHQTMLSSIPKDSLSASVINTSHTRTSSSSSSNDLFYDFSSTDKKRLGKNNQSTNKVSKESDSKRKDFLERNRIAALKCRQRKKQWLQNLQTKVEYLTADNEQYNMQMNLLREELIRLKTILIGHKDCPINQQATTDALNRSIPGLPSLVQPCEYVNNIPVIQNK